ncbi:Tetraspanin-11 [Vespula squamosa]|uniref:Tetraspanin-11 n=1 Tax=Vespula squamosa TaxID=30214 RepID=A0ABD2AYH9_VESSQ
METRRLALSRAFVCCTNIIFLISGFILMSLGALLLADNERILLSRLLGPSDVQPDQPLFYYLAFAISALGFFIAITGLFGCWAACLFNQCITISYVVTITLLLLSECTIFIVAIFWPYLLGIDVRPARLIRALQRSYAVPGREQFTAALDLAQTTFSCCGINGSNNYGTSWWRLQEVGRRELVVPLTCCTLNNANETDSFLNPEPANLTLCQALNPAEHQYARHTTGCLEMIERWTQEQALILLAIGLSIIFVEVSVLLSTFFACSKNSKRKKSQTSTFTSTQTLSPFTENDHDFGLGIENRMHMSGGSENLEEKKVIEHEYDKPTRHNGRSIIEDWKDSSKCDENVIRSDQLYEERAVDVIMDYHNHRHNHRQTEHFPTECNKQIESSLLRIDIPKENKESKESVIKIKRPQGGGTVRSIPIKDYQSSIAQNIGTLRRSMAPQLQFESLVSEPEKNIPSMIPSKQRISIINNDTSNNQQRSMLPLESEKSSNPCNEISKCLDTLTRKEDSVNDGKSMESVRKGSVRDFNDTANYFRRSYRKRLSSNCRKIRDSKDDKEFARTRSHVGQKIYVYEENARRNERNFDPVLDSKKHRTIGVPLVGMHNACGLPVIASWNDAEIFQPLQTSTTVLGTLAPALGGSRVSSNLRRRTHSKRRAPDPTRSNHTIARVKRNDSKRSTIKGDDENNTKRKRNRLSFKTMNRPNISSKNSFKRTVRGGKYTLGKASLINTLDRKVSKRNAKRRTLYARDDGEEAVQALKNLCLNPLARNESQEDMMW